MICPHCQSELAVEDFCCRRCGAPLRGLAAPFGLRLRTMAIAGVMLTITSLILVDCVLHHLPGGMAARTGIAQAPDTRSTELRRLMLMSQHHQQPSQNEPPPPPRR